MKLHMRENDRQLSQCIVTYKPCIDIPSVTVWITVRDLLNSETGEAIQVTLS